MIIATLRYNFLNITAWREIIEKNQDGNHGGQHPKSNDYVEYGVPFIMAKDLVDIQASKLMVGI